MIFKRNTESVADVRKRERMEAQNVKQQADIDYLAMMTDVEIPTDDEEDLENE